MRATPLGQQLTDATKHQFLPPTRSRGPRPRQPDDETLTITFQVQRRFAAALRSAIEEIANEIGGRLEARFAIPTERAYTAAAIGLAAVRVAITAQVPAVDADYKDHRFAGRKPDPTTPEATETSSDADSTSSDAETE